MNEGENPYEDESTKEILPFSKRWNTHLKIGLPGLMVDGRPINIYVNHAIPERASRVNVT